MSQHMLILKDVPSQSWVIKKIEKVYNESLNSLEMSTSKGVPKIVMLYTIFYFNALL